MSKPFYETDSEKRWWFGLTGRAVLTLVVVTFLVVIIAASPVS
jgi:hypothetical protein